MGTELEVDPEICRVGPLGSRRAAMPARQEATAHLAPYGGAGAEAGWARCCIVGQWEDVLCTKSRAAVLPWQVTRPVAVATVTYMPQVGKAMLQHWLSAH